MHIVGYVLIFLSTSYSAIRIFGLGWSTRPASFLNESLFVGIITFIAGVIASFPKKAEFWVICICAIWTPGMIFLLMLQGIIQNRAFHEIHWLAIPLGGTALAIVSFFLSRRMLKYIY